MRLIEEVDVAPAPAPPSAAAAAAVAAGTAAVNASRDEWGGGDGGEVPMQVPNLTSAEAAQMEQLREKYGGKRGGDATNTGGNAPNVSG